MSAGGRVEIPPDKGFLQPALSFVSSYAESLGMEEPRRQSLLKAAGHAIELVLANNQNGAGHAVSIDVFEEKGTLKVEVLNRGVPIFIGGKLFQEVAAQLDKVSLENLGRQGQTVVLAMRLGEAALRKSLGSVPATPLDLSGDITIRDLLTGEEGALSQLFYYVYGYDYINEWVYYPEKIQKLREEGKLISIVGALQSGRLSAHVGLIKWGDNPPVYEPCLGVVDPAMKSRGLFGAVFQKAMERVSEIPMQYLFFDFVTNHDLSQRFVARYEPRDIAIFVGCQSKATQAKLEKLGLGEDSAEMDRYSLLYSIIPRVAHPFGTEILLPASLGEMLGFLLKPIGVSWSPASRFEQLPAEGEFQTHYQTAQNAVVFDCFAPGRQAVERILREWSQLLRSGYQYAAVEVPVKTRGLGNLYDMLAKAGFFVAGFVPYHHSGELGIRLQALGPTKVAWDDIKLHSATAKRLLSIIRGNYERNTLL